MSLIVVFGLLAAVLAETPHQVHISLGERIDEMVVMWSTYRSSDWSTVEYGLSQALDMSANGTWQMLNNRGAHQYVHTVKLTDLKNATHYYYRCGDGVEFSGVYKFRTLQRGSDWRPRVIIYGDLGYRDGTSTPSLIEEALNETTDFIIHNGDIAYDLHTNNGHVGDNFMNMIEPVAARLPYMVSVGNHEAFNWNFTNYKTRFNMPGTDDNLWYSFKAGPIHFIIISTEVYFFLLYGGLDAVKSHYKWLDDTLTQANLPHNRAKWPWVVTLGHRPMYCSNTALRYCRLETNPVRVGFLRVYGLEEILYKHGVDVAFWGHNHCYERLFPTYDGEVYNGSFSEPYRNPRATIHITSGVAGNQEGTSNFRGVRQPWSAFGSTEKSYTRLIPYNRSHLFLQQVSAEKKGKIIDSLFIIKEKNGLFPQASNKRRKRIFFG
ncbi:acid phosphatase type 7 [Parasteatoda tepidariorum]|uniref:acid phosphatase type 7 n=1 Tax=Parasteatoda tepidariorum TaxID=114398 RepID=UPI00077F8BC6|nr:acid phosphatase type 7 [Parasteatoda tepidariorum]